MSKEDYAAAKIDTLTDLCERTNELLSKALNITHDIVGVPDSGESKTAEEAACAIEKLRHQLEMAHTRAQILLNQLDCIASKI